MKTIETILKELKKVSSLWLYDETEWQNAQAFIRSAIQTAFQETRVEEKGIGAECECLAENCSGQCTVWFDICRQEVTNKQKEFLGKEKE